MTPIDSLFIIKIPGKFPSFAYARKFKNINALIRTKLSSIVVNPCNKIFDSSIRIFLFLPSIYDIRLNYLFKIRCQKISKIQKKIKMGSSSGPFFTRSFSRRIWNR